MTRSTTDDNSVLLVHAYLDGELDPANALGIAQQMSTDPALAAESERVKALQRLIHERLPREEAPAGLHARVEASVGGLRRQHVQPLWRALAASIALSAQPSWRALAASIALTAMVTGTSTWLVVESQQQPIMVADTLVSDHIRALIAPEPVDVASSDRHTVKPWFNGRIPNSPRVVDLAKQDFPLIGGRIGVVGQTPVPTLVYRHAKHLISLTEVPAESQVLNRTPRAVNGYNIVHWIENGVSYWAISDVALKDLEDFARFFRISPTEL
jgi:anti-sigma factor RsiW